MKPPGPEGAGSVGDLHLEGPAAGSRYPHDPRAPHLPLDGGGHPVPEPADGGEPAAVLVAGGEMEKEVFESLDAESGETPGPGLTYAADAEEGPGLRGAVGWGKTAEGCKLMGRGLRARPGCPSSTGASTWGSGA